jgi:hypothetical protein
MDISYSGQRKNYYNKDPILNDLLKFSDNCKKKKKLTYKKMNLSR